MAFPPGFRFANEETFTQEFLVPLFQRLGFSCVVNYHGCAELGKDLVLAEFDRLGHVRYHGVQAKHQASISLNQCDELVSDCKQAFNNPFQHPQTGANERISSFYVVTAGSMGQAAIQHYFNSLLPLYGDNARLLQGRDLLPLDRSASSNRTENVSAVLSGIRVELAINGELAAHMSEHATKNLTGTKTWMVTQLRTEALSAYLTQPILPESLSITLVVNYLRVAEGCNREMDRLASGLLGEEMAKAQAGEVLKQLKLLGEYAARIDAAAEQAAKSIGSLVPM